MVPLRLSRVYPFSSPLCFRECNSLGIMYHIWWECQRLRVFWNKFFALIQKISEILVPQQPRIALLNEPIENLPRCKQRLIFLCCQQQNSLQSAHGRRLLSIYRRKVSWIMLNEQFTGVFNDTTKRFKTIWSPWADYVHVKLQGRRLAWAHSLCTSCCTPLSVFFFFLSTLFFPPSLVLFLLFAIIFSMALGSKGCFFQFCHSQGSWNIYAESPMM